MLGLGLGEMLIVAAVALVVVGPDNLPKVMRQLGRWYGQARRAADDLRRAFVLEADRQDAAERYQQLQERRRRAQEARQRAQETRGQRDDDPVAQDIAPMGAAAGPAEDGDDRDDPNAHPPDAPHPTHPRPPIAEEGP